VQGDLGPSVSAGRADAHAGRRVITTGHSDRPGIDTTTRKRAAGRAFPERAELGRAWAGIGRRRPQPAGCPPASGLRPAQQCAARRDRGEPNLRLTTSSSDHPGVPRTSRASELGHLSSPEPRASRPSRCAGPFSCQCRPGHLARPAITPLVSVHQRRPSARSRVIMPAGIALGHSSAPSHPVRLLALATAGSAGHSGRLDRVC